MLASSFNSVTHDSSFSVDSLTEIIRSAISGKNAILRPKDACKHLGIGRTLLWKLEQTDPDFPTKIIFSARCVGWRVSDLDAYLAKKAGC